MKTLSRLSLATLMVFHLSCASAQIRPLPATEDHQQLAKFDLDFPGGQPRELVAAIQKAMGRQLNAIVSDHDAEQKLPPLKMKGVNVAQLFNAMFMASQSQVLMASGGNYSQLNNINFGFRSEPPITDDSVWYFVTNLPPQSKRDFCRFYLLKPYLQAGLSVDDITTAIQTSWKMLGTAMPPRLSFHKETSLLIAVGLTNDLAAIDDVLKALGAQSTRSSQTPVPTASDVHVEK